MPSSTCKNNQHDAHNIERGLRLPSQSVALFAVLLLLGPYTAGVVLIFFLRLFFFFNDTATTEIYTLSLHDALPISQRRDGPREGGIPFGEIGHEEVARSEEHTSELQSPKDLVCRLLLEKKKKLNKAYCYLNSLRSYVSKLYVIR